MKPFEFTSQDLEQTYQDLTVRVIADCTFTSELVGGMPADQKGVQAYVQHHLGLEGDEAERAVKRIMEEEIGENKPNLTDGEEIDEKEVYAINQIRRGPAGPWVGDWMIKACIKSALSRAGLFQQKRGTKGDVAEMGRVSAIGKSLAEPDHPERVYLYSDNGAVTTSFEKFMGRVNTPQGAKSICHWSETAPPGTHFSFEFRFAEGKIDADDVKKMGAMIQIIGLGSAKAMERGKFRVDRMRIE